MHTIVSRVGIVVEEQYSNGGAVRYMFDEKTCPKCGAVMLNGFGNEIHKDHEDFSRTGSPHYILRIT